DRRLGKRRRGAWWGRHGGRRWREMLPRERRARLLQRQVRRAHIIGGRIFGRRHNRRPGGGVFRQRLKLDSVPEKLLAQVLERSGIIVVVEVDVLDAAKLEMHSRRTPQNRDDRLAVVQIAVPLVLDVTRRHRVWRDDHQHDAARIETLLNRRAPLDPGGNGGDVQPDLRPYAVEVGRQTVRKFLIDTTVTDENVRHGGDPRRNSSRRKGYRESDFSSMNATTPRKITRRWKLVASRFGRRSGGHGAFQSVRGGGFGFVQALDVVAQVFAQ